ncbi:MAG: SpoIIE family protein phosphatase [Pirellulaceae bacterium]
MAFPFFRPIFSVVMVSDDKEPIRVLLIEDNDDDVVLVRETLRDAGERQFHLETVPRLAVGLARLDEAHVDVVLLDLSLPDSHGIDTFNDVRAHSSEVPIVVLSGDANDAVAMESMRRGAQDYLVKGAVDGELLGRTLRYAITRHRLTAQLQASEHRLRLLAEQLPALIWTTDLSLRLTSARGRNLEVQQPGLMALMGKELHEFFECDNPSFPLLEMHRQALEGKPTSHDVSWHGRRYHAHVEPLRNRLNEIVGTIGVALDVTHEHKLKRDIEAAHRVQQHLLPSTAPDLPGFDIAGGCFPAEHCSGDFFDYIPLPGDRLAIVLADVSGHGFGPAIMASAIRSYLRTAAVLGNHVHEMLALGNRLLANDSEASPFASVFSARVDARSRSFQFASAGHPAYLIRHSGEVKTLESTCVPIGVRDDEVFPLSRPIRIHHGDILLLASDGVFEARKTGNQFFGLERSLAVVRSVAHRPAKEIVAKLHRAACEFAGSTTLDDDLTAVVVKRQPKTTSVDGRHGSECGSPG